MVLAAFLVGEFYRFMVRESVSEISGGRQEVADLLDKLTEAAHVNKRGEVNAKATCSYC